MKVHIYGKSHSPMSGYENIPFDEMCELLDNTVHDAEAQEIILNNSLEFLQPEDVIPFLERVISKLRHRGTLIVNGTDAHTVARHFSAHKIGIEEFNMLLLGKKSTALTMNGMRNFLSINMGLEIVSVKLEEYSYVIRTQRP